MTTDRAALGKGGDLSEFKTAVVNMQKKIKKKGELEGKKHRRPYLWEKKENRRN